MEPSHITDDEWKRRLTPEQYHVLRERGTETPGSGAFLNHTETGEYTCAACGAALFTSDSKYESTVPGLIGWPSFADSAGTDTVGLRRDTSLGMERVEAFCKNCGSHLGHIFPDESSPTGDHYCINSVALDFKKTV